MIREFLLTVDGNKYRDPQLEKDQRVKDLGTLGPKWDVSINTQPPHHCGFRELFRRKGRNIGKR